VSSCGFAKTNRWFVVDWLTSYPNCNLVSNCAGSPRCFSIHWNWSENLIMTLFSTDGILFEVRNRKKRWHAWSLVAMTSHVWTLSMLLFQDLTGTSITVCIQTPVIRSDNVGMSLTRNQVHSLVLVYHRATSLWLHQMLHEPIPYS
jgi:hypothetical protein